MQSERILAIDGVCAWPNLTPMPDGAIVATIFNQPCHGMWEGDLDCWASTDGGITWQFRGCPAPHEPGTNRMNCAAGLTANGDLIVLASGWTDRDVPGKPRPHSGGPHTLPAWVCRSSDGGQTWQVTSTLPDSGQRFAYIPFGDVLLADDGALCASVYGMDGNGQDVAYFIRSYDDGYTWGEPTVLNPAGNETTVLHLGSGRWLAASRLVQLDLFASEDDGRTWNHAQQLTEPQQIPGHLLRLRDGRILLTYGSRISGQLGVEAKLSEDEGKSWNEPVPLADMPGGDGGYPSSVQREDGTIVTAFYNQRPERGEYQYQMDVVVWGDAVA